MVDEINLIHLLKNAINSKTEFRATCAAKAFSALIQYLYMEDYMQIPKNLCEFYSFLNKVPCCDYLKQVSSDESFCDNGEINFEVLQLLDEDSPEEIVQREIMKKILIICRQRFHQREENDTEDSFVKRKLLWEERYCKCRNLFSEKAVRDSILFEQELQELELPSELEEIVRCAYVPVAGIPFPIKICPVCGKVVQKNHQFCCSNAVCNYYIQKEDLSEKEMQIKGKAIELLPGIYKFVLSPGIAEKRICEMLRKEFSSYEICMYPEVDHYDINIKNRNKCIHLDVKDVHTPAILLNVLEQDSDLEKMKYSEEDPVYLVIPEHRISIYAQQEKGKDYMHQLTTLLKNEKHKIQVVGERQLLRVVKEEMGGMNG